MICGPTEALTDICRILESGTNVVATSIVALTYPTPNNGEMLSQLEAACAKGSSSFYLSGIDPGFAIDLLPAALLTAAHQVDTVRVREVLNYATYDQAEILFDIMGFGKPLDADALLFLPGSLSYAWGGVVHMLAAVLGTELDEVARGHRAAGHGCRHRGGVRRRQGGDDGGDALRGAGHRGR